jgi:hypothetical protein
MWRESGERNEDLDYWWGGYVWGTAESWLLMRGSALLYMLPFSFFSNLFCEAKREKERQEEYIQTKRVSDRRQLCSLPQLSHPKHHSAHFSAHGLSLTLPLTLPVSTPAIPNGKPIVIWGGSSAMGALSISYAKLAG